MPWAKIARPNQLPPEGDWQIWLILAGRGFGKTRSIVEFAMGRAETMPGSRGALVAPTAADARDVLVEGESGILAVSRPGFRPIYEPSKRRLTWPNGSRATLFSADEPQRLRGPQHHWGICDELAAWRFVRTAWDNFLMGLRLGKNPQVAIATTPRPIPLIKDLLKDPTVVTTTGTTYDNAANLATPFLNKILRRYEGTTIGRQELYGAVLDDMPGALFRREEIDRYRVTQAPELVRVIIGVDPQGAQGEENAETGIVAAGIGADGHGYVLDDVSLSASPALWGKAAVTAYFKHRGDRIVGEVNNGGDMVEHTIRTVRDGDKPVGQTIPFKQVRASRGKVTRAEPIAALYEQGRIHHVGMFGALEDQQCQWVPGDKSPDRLDALVWALTELMLAETPPSGAARARTRGLWGGNRR